MAIYGYSTFPQTLASREPHYQIVLCNIEEYSFGECLTPLKWSSQCIIQPQPTEQFSRNKTKKETIWLRALIWGDHELELSAPSFLFMESYALQKSTNNNITSKILHEFIRWVYRLLESLMLWIVYSENFLNFRFDAIAKQNIINPSHNRSKNYTSVVLSDSEVIFHRKGEDAAFCPLIYCILFIYGVAKSKVLVIKFSCLPYIWEYFI